MLIRLRNRCYSRFRSFDELGSVLTDRATLGVVKHTPGAHQTAVIGQFSN